MEVRKYELSGYDQHFIDCATEAFELDSSSFLVLNLYGNPDKIRNIIDKKGNTPSLKIRLKTCDELTEYADSILPRINKQLRGKILHDESKNLCYKFCELTETYANWAITDMCEGGCLKPFKEKGFNPYLPTKKIRRKLHSRKWIHNYLKNLDITEKSIISKKIINHINRASKIDQDLIISGFYDIHELIKQQRTNTLKKLRNDYYYIDKKARKRAIKLATTILGKQITADFINKKPVLIYGKDVNFELINTIHSMYKDHGAVNFTVLDKKNNKLCTACIYVEDTPAIDQLIAFYLYVNSGNEKELISKGNIRTITDLGYESNVIKRKPKEPNTPKIIKNYFSTMHQQHERFHEYYEETKHKWFQSFKDNMIYPNLKNSTNKKKATEFIDKFNLK